MGPWGRRKKDNQRRASETVTKGASVKEEVASGDPLALWASLDGPREVTGKPSGRLWGFLGVRWITPLIVFFFWGRTYP